MQQRIKPFLNIIYPIAVALVLLAAWAITAKVVGVNLLVPSIDETFAKLGELLSSGRFWQAVGGTLWRSLRSCVYAVLTAAVLSVMAKLSRVAERIFDPIVTVLRAVPTMSIILITLIWLSAKSAPVLIAYLITFPILYNSFLSALKSVDGRLIQMAEVYKVPFLKRLTTMYIPGITPDVLSALKSAVSLSLKVTIASEVLAQTRLSMGSNMQRSMAYFETAELFAWTIVAIVFSYLLELVVMAIRLAVVRWKNEA